MVESYLQELSCSTGACAERQAISAFGYMISLASGKEMLGKQGGRSFAVERAIHTGFSVCRLCLSFSYRASKLHLPRKYLQSTFCIQLTKNNDYLLEGTVILLRTLWLSSLSNVGILSGDQKLSETRQGKFAIVRCLTRATGYGTAVHLLLIVRNVLNFWLLLRGLVVKRWLD